MKSFLLKKNFSFILPVMFSLFFMDTQHSGDDPVTPVKSSMKEMTINPVLGDISFVSKYGYLPNATTDENLRIVTHFEYVENLLRQKDVSNLSPELQQRRQQMINLFHDYKVAGKFPRNYDYSDQRRPCFIDKDNTICAVGYLVEQTAGRTAAEAINEKFKYDDLLDMNYALVDDWVAESGLTKEEVAMIQPTYGPYYPPCNGNKILVCRMNNCKYECKCLHREQADEWIARGKPCDTDVPSSAFNNENPSVGIVAGAGDFNHPNREVINPIIGDLSFVSTFGYEPTASTDEDLRIRTHLSFVENSLRNKDVSGLSPMMQDKRTYLLDRLKEYWQTGKFPRNYDYPDRRPCFIDRDNTICAVGYLIEKSAGRDVANQINSIHQYDDILDMHDPVVDRWINESGFSETEIAMIQPFYGGGWWPPCWPPPAPEQVKPCKGSKVWLCTYYCCDAHWDCKCVPPSQSSGGIIINGDPCSNGNGNNGNGNGYLGEMSYQDASIPGSIQVHPNPASGSAKVTFNTEDTGIASIHLFDVQGNLVRTLLDESVEAGMHVVTYDIDVPDGMYLVSVRAGNQLKTERLLVMN